MGEFNFAAYQGPGSMCTGRATKGALALRDWTLAVFERAGNGGVYNCRSIAGTSNLSLHGEGRAFDAMVAPGPDGRGSDYGHAILEALATHGKALGIMCIIYDRKIYSAISPAGRPYKGVHPHYDHLHIEITWVAASALTVEAIATIVGGPVPEPKPPTPEPPTPKPPAPKPKEVYQMMPTIDLRKVGKDQRTWVRSAHVRTLQGLLLARGHAVGKLDGIGGPATKAAVAAFQVKTNTGDGAGKADFIVGAGTWKKLLGL